MSEYGLMSEWVSVRDFGAKADGVTDDTGAIEAAVAACAAAGKALYLPGGSYRSDAVISSRVRIIGEGSRATKISPYTAGGFSFTIDDRLGSWDFACISDIGFEGYGGIRFGMDTQIPWPAAWASNTTYALGDFAYVGSTVYQSLQNNNTGHDPTTSPTWWQAMGGPSNATGRWVFDRLVFWNSGVGLLKQDGNIGNRFNQCSWEGPDGGSLYYGYYAWHRDAASDGTMHCGCDEFNGCSWRNASKAAIYINDPEAGAAQWLFNGGVIHGNTGFGLFVHQAGRNAGGWVPTIQFRGTWFEINATAGNATIEHNGPGGDDDETLTPKDIYLKDVERCTARDIFLRRIQLVNAVMYAYDCRAGADETSAGKVEVDADSDSAFVTDGSYAYTFAHGSGIIYADSVSAGKTAWGAYNYDVFSTRARTHAVNSASALDAQPFNSPSPITFTKTLYDGTPDSTRDSTPVGGGNLWDTCHEVTVPAQRILKLPDFTAPTGKYVFTSFAIRQVTNTLRDAGVEALAALDEDACADMGTGRWYTFANIRSSVGAGSTLPTRFYLAAPAGNDVTVQLAEYQVMVFNTLQEAIEWAKSGRYCHSTAYRGRVAWGTAVPTAGSWSVGDIVYNTSPSAGGSIGWVCTAQGTPGTWKTFGAIAA